MTSSLNPIQFFMTQNKLAVIAFGGNALLKSNQKGTYAEQIQNVTENTFSLNIQKNSWCGIRTSCFS